MISSDPQNGECMSTHIIPMSQTLNWPTLKQAGDMTALRFMKHIWQSNTKHDWRIPSKDLINLLEWWECMRRMPCQHSQDLNHKKALCCAAILPDRRECSVSQGAAGIRPLDYRSTWCALISEDCDMFHHHLPYRAIPMPSSLPQERCSFQSTPKTHTKPAFKY